LGQTWEPVFTGLTIGEVMFFQPDCGKKELHGGSIQRTVVLKWLRHDPFSAVFFTMLGALK
jgi:hypothetical protein